MLVEAALQDREAVEIATERRKLAALTHESEIVAHRKIVEHRPLLRAIGHAGATACGRVTSGDRRIVEENTSAGGGQITSQQFHQRRLADSVAAEDAQNFA